MVIISTKMSLTTVLKWIATKVVPYPKIATPKQVGRSFNKSQFIAGLCFDLPPNCWLELVLDTELSGKGCDYLSVDFKGTVSRSLVHFV